MCVCVCKKITDGEMLVEMLECLASCYCCVYPVFYAIRQQFSSTVILTFSQYSLCMTNKLGIETFTS